ncbi:MAG TPA: hypothetical protein VHD61_14340 [Lacunisphaera sp.]|nr:hypothetical protein [Lacunisphaera sp.]
MIRTRICLYVLLLTPFLVYSQTIFHEYGFRDDYANLREAREEPSKIVHRQASQGRPLGGALVETTFNVVNDVTRLPLMRFLGVALLTLLAIALWRQLFQSGWSEIEAAAIGLGLVLLPAGQVMASWASGWPLVLALLLAVAGFSAIETELERGGLKRVVALLGGCLIYSLAAFIYQANAFFALVPIVAVLLVRSGRESLTDRKWCAIHLAALGIGVGFSYLVVRMMFNNGVFIESGRLRLEPELFTKLVWFFWQPLPDALALYALRDNFNVGAGMFWGAVVVVVAVLAFAWRTGMKAEATLGRRWALSALAAPFLAHGFNLFSADRTPGYRTLFPLAGLVLVLVIFGLRSLRTTGHLKLPVYYGALALLVAVAAWTAFQNSVGLIAEPQGNEWELFQNAVNRTSFKAGTKVYCVLARPDDRSTDRSFADEFGAITAGTDEAASEMFKAAMRDRYGAKLPKGVSFTFASGLDEPARGAYDLVIDVRKLKTLRAR